MEVLESLNHALLKKNTARKSCRLDPGPYLNMAAAFAAAEHSLAVLSDMQRNKSYLFHSKTAVGLGLDFPRNPMVIDSIWEDEILQKMHPDDRMGKYIHELKFFRWMETVPPVEREDFSVVSVLRMQDINRQYRLVKHRMFYFYSPDNGKLRFALCLYNFAPASSKEPGFSIINTVTGKTVSEDPLMDRCLLTRREQEVLKLIGEGLTSKNIASLLCISINTVSRHRQNILEKLNVKNSVEAFLEVKPKVELLSQNK